MFETYVSGCSCTSTNDIYLSKKHILNFWRVRYRVRKPSAGKHVFVMSVVHAYSSDHNSVLFKGHL